MFAHNTRFWRFKHPLLRRILKGQSCAFHLTTSFNGILPNATRQEYLSEFWKKYEIQDSIARYFRTRDGWLLTHLNRSAGVDFTEEEQALLGLLVPHLRSVVEEADSDSPVMFVDGQGRMVSADARAEVALHEHPEFTDRLRTLLPRWVARLSTEPFRSFAEGLEAASAVEVELNFNSFSVVVVEQGGNRATRLFARGTVRWAFGSNGENNSGAVVLYREVYELTPGGPIRYPRFIARFRPAGFGMLELDADQDCTGGCVTVPLPPS